MLTITTLVYIFSLYLSSIGEKFDKNDEKRLIHWEDEMADSYLSKKEKDDSNSMYEKVISSSNRYVFQ